MAVVTCLHLSDLHFKSGDECEEFNQGIVLKALWKDIRTQIAKGLKPDFIVFSGDVAYHGRKEEYELAIERFFDPLLDISGLSKDRLFVVPGNHDVDWDGIDSIIVPGMVSLLTSRDDINQFLSPTRDRRLAFGKFNAYAEFVSSYFDGALTFSAAEYFYSRILETQGYRIGIIGLNSAWMSALLKDSQDKVLDQGNLLIGERQLLAALEGIEEADLRVAFFHHPIDWLHEIERFDIERRLQAECDLILHGHWHEPQVQVEESMAGHAVRIPSGAVYAHRDHPNSYGFVQVNLDSRQGEVYLRRYNDKGPGGPEWVKDILSTGEDRDGVFEFSLFHEVLEVVPASLSSDSKRILLVEDEPDWQDAIRSILVLPDFDLQVAVSYAEARAKLRTPFDLIIINLCLVHDNDYEGVALLDDLTAHVVEDYIPACIVLTGRAGSTRGLYDRYNVCEVFIKGRAFNKAQFLKEVREAVGS